MIFIESWDSGEMAWNVNGIGPFYGFADENALPQKNGRGRPPITK
jgi:hypothetical protein